MDSQQAKGLEWLKNLMKISLERWEKEPMTTMDILTDNANMGQNVPGKIGVIPAPTIHNLYSNATALHTRASRKQGAK